MKIFAMVLLSCLSNGSIVAQEYKVSTTQRDAFSVALVKLMNCAANGFSDCKGKLIRSTALMGDDHQLTINFPGSAAAILRIRDWEKNAYIEFHGYADKPGRIKGVYDIVRKIKKAMGPQLYDRYEEMKKNDVDFYGLSVKDRNGFFSMNMEVFSGATSAPVYLLGPEREDESKPAQDIVLLKIYGGIPSYQYYIRPASPPDKKLDSTIRQIISGAEKDFSSPAFEATNALQLSKKKTDTILVHGSAVTMDYRRANHSAMLSFPVRPDSVQFTKQWNYLQRSLQAAVGTNYVYQVNKLQDETYILYFSKDANEKKPRIYLETAQDDPQHPVIEIRIESGYPHETNRTLSAGDH